jgi:hypothetical protein
MALGANGLNLAVFEEAQQHRLHAQAHLSDFIEKDRPAMRDLKLAGFVAVRTRETAFDVSEQLRLEERIGQRRTVHRDEGTCGCGVNVRGCGGRRDPCRPRFRP